MMMKKKNKLKSLGVATSVLSACLLTFTGLARGQGRTWAGSSFAQMIEGARWRLGLFRINTSLSIANSGYDTDIYYGFLDHPVPDFTLSASVPLQVLLPFGKKVVLEIQENPQYLFFGKTKKERAWNNVFAGRIHFALERFYIQGGGSYSDVRQRLSPELNVIVREKLTNLGGIVLWQTNENLSVATIYNYGQYNYGEAIFGDVSIAQTQNRGESYFDLVTYFQPSTKIRLSLDGQYGAYDFTAPGASIRNTRSYAVFAGLSFVTEQGQVTPVDPPRGSIGLGYKSFDVLDKSYTDGSGFVGTIDFSIGLFPKTSARAFFLRDFAFSVYSDSSFYLTTAFGGGLRRRLSRRASLSYDFAYNRSAYPMPETSGIPTRGDFSYLNHFFGLNLRLSRYLQVTLQAMLSERRSSTNEAVESRNFFGISLDYGVPAGVFSAPVRGLFR